MDRNKIKIVVVMLCACLLGGALYQSGALKAGNIGTTDPIRLSPKNLGAELGSAANPFTVLEIVPSHEMAQFGYFIPGCEPVDMEAAKFNVDVRGEFTSTMDGVIYDITDRKLFAFYDQIPVDSMSTVNPYNDPLYMTRSELNYSSDWKNYGQWRKGWSENYSQKGNWVEAAGGGFSQEGGKYVYKGAGQGNYRWEQSEEGSSVRYPNGDLFEYSYIEYKHKDQFIRDAFSEFDEEGNLVREVTSDEFQSQVITLTPAELEGYLTNDGNDIIDTADLIYIHAGSGNYSGIANIYYHLNTNGHTESDGTNSDTTFLDAGHDLTYMEVMRIAKRMASDEPAALIMDMTKMFAADTLKKEYNCHKLIYMTLLYRPEFFWETFGDYLDSYTGKDGTAKVEYTMGNKEGEYAPYRFWGVEEKCPNWTYGGTTYGSVNNPFMFHPTTGAPLFDQARYYNINSGGNNIFDKIFTFQGDTATLQSILNGSISNASMEDGLFANNVTADAFTGENEGKKSLTNMAAIRFLFKKALYTPKLRVLELEGCDEYIYGSEGWEEYYQKIFSWIKTKPGEESWLKDKDKIEVTTMPTWEFIGSVGRYKYEDESGNPKVITVDSSDDLIAKYDLILIGSKQNAANGKGGYNEYTDPKTGQAVNLGNLIYTSVGGTYTNGAISEMGEATFSEQLDMRHAGNDITLKKLLELQDFLKAGKPIVVDSALYSGSSVDTAKVDPSSKIYDLLTSGNSNIFVHGKIPAKTMQKLISQNVCRLVFDSELSYPAEYDYTNSGTTQPLQDFILPTILRDDDNNVLMDFKFYIDGGSGKYTYKVSLNLDMNGDGVFAGSLKELAEKKNMQRVAGTSYLLDDIEQARVMKIYGDSYDDGDLLGVSSTYELSAGIIYRARCPLPSSAQGMLPWKLEVQCVQNESLRSSAIGYTRVPPTGDPNTIRVLQMNLWPDMQVDGPITTSRYGQPAIFTSFTRDSLYVRSGDTYADYVRRKGDGEPEIDPTDRLYSMLSQNQRKTVAKFENYIEPVTDFDVKIYYMFNSDWYQLFGGGDSNALENWKNFLVDYDMLVFGFTDGSVFTSNSVFAEGVKDFVDQGKSMILSHDTMYGSNGTDVYGDYNSWLRTVSGQRRSYYNKNGGSYVKSFNEVDVNGTRFSFVSQDNLEDSVDADGNVTGENLMKKYFDLLTEAVDGDTVESNFWNTWVNEWPDNETYLQICAQGTDSMKASLGNTERVTKNGKTNSYPWAHPYSRETTFVKLTNNGQITTYPYKLNDVIEVLSTHTQYYQLDMEYLFGGDVNVWFTLSDIYDPDVEAYAKKLHGESDYKNYANGDVNIYSAKDQDCRNSFYIYNKGNITYTGSGHGEAYGYGQENALMTDEEVMLFVNTMISAYRQPVSRPKAIINNADAHASDGTAVLYLDYEPVSDNPLAGLLGAGSSDDISRDHRVAYFAEAGQVMVKIDFSVRDDVCDGKRYRIRLKENGTIMNSGNLFIYKRDAAGNPTGSRLTVQRDALGNDYYIVDADDSEDGIAYTMYVPYKDYIENGSERYTIGAFAEYTRNGRNLKTPVNNTDAMLMNIPLFDLN